MVARREFLQWSGLALASWAAGAWARNPTDSAAKALRRTFANIEARSGGRLGVQLLDTGSGRRIGWREQESFPMCSTFKFLLAAAILREADAGQLALDRRLPIRKEDLLVNSPVAEKHVGPTGLSVGELCQATMIHSDNAAANLLLPLIGGPAGLTRFARSLGDPRTRLDRNEPALGTAIPGDPRDTTTPGAIVSDMQRLLLSDVLTPASRQRLTEWLVDNRTGGKRLRAGLPADWRVGDKTGKGDHATTNDIAILWPPGHAPLLLACYFTQSSLDDNGQNRVHRDVAAAAAQMFAQDIARGL